MLLLSSLTDIIAYTDPASGKKGEQLKRTKARQAIVVVGQDVIARIFTLYAWADRLTTDGYIEQIFKVNEMFRPQRFGVEANGMQVSLGDTFQIIAQLKGIRIPLEPIYQPTNVTKEWRNRARLQPVMANGRLFVRDDQMELKAELFGHPNFPTVDLVDALATAVDMLPDRRAQQQADDSDIRNLAQYMRDSGLPPSYIQKRIAEIQQERLEHAQGSILLPLASGGPSATTRGT